MKLDIYKDILLQDHWFGFLSFLNKSTDIFESISYDEWVSKTQENESESLLKLFGNDALRLVGLIEKYFKSQFNDNSSNICMRCNKDFVTFLNEDCTRCGWMYQDVSSLGKEVVTESIRINKEINQKFILTQLQAIKHETQLSQVDQSKIHLSVKQKQIEHEIEQIKRQIEEIQRKEERGKQEKKRLERQFDSLEKEINQLTKRLKNSESLFLKYDPDEIRHIIQIRFRDGVLTAQTDKDLVFPIDLVMGLQEFSGHRRQRNFENTSCFMFLPLSYWEKNNYGNLWRFDLKKYLTQHVEGEYYVCSFSHLHKKEYP